MDCNRNFDQFQHTSLLLLSFLEQKGCQNLLPTNDNYIDSDGDLQTDGHCYSNSYRDILHDLQNHVQPELPVDAEEAQAVRELAAELIRIADLLEQRVLFQAADSLTKKLDTCPTQFWARHLSNGVQGLLSQVSGAKEFKKELLEMAFTFVLMKTVCERVPRLLLNLYDSVVQHFGSR